LVIIHAYSKNLGKFSALRVVQISFDKGNSEIDLTPIDCEVDRVISFLLMLLTNLIAVSLSGLCDCEFVCEPSKKSLLLQDIINPVNRTAIIALTLYVHFCLFIIILNC
jgi:hypothetical protein